MTMEGKLRRRGEGGKSQLMMVTTGLSYDYRTIIS